MNRIEEKLNQLKEKEGFYYIYDRWITRFRRNEKTDQGTGGGRC